MSRLRPLGCCSFSRFPGGVGVMRVRGLVVGLLVGLVVFLVLLVLRLGMGMGVACWVLRGSVGLVCLVFLRV